MSGVGEELELRPRYAFGNIPALTRRALQIPCALEDEARQAELAQPRSCIELGQPPDNFSQGARVPIPLGGAPPPCRHRVGDSLRAKRLGEKGVERFPRGCAEV